MATLQDVLTYIDTIYPNKMATQTKINIINDEQRKVFKFMNPTGMATITTIADQFSYSVPADCQVDLIQQLLVTSSTEAVAADTAFNNYEFAGLDQDMASGNFYYEAFGKVGLYPVPDKNGYTGRIIYSKRPVLFATIADAAVEFNTEADWIDVIKFRVIARVAKSGNNPDVELGNNYEADANEMERRLKMDRANKKMRNPRQRVSYAEGWNK